MTARARIFHSRSRSTPPARAARVRRRRRGRSFARAHEIVIIDAEGQGPGHLPHAAARGASREVGHFGVVAPGERTAERRPAGKQQRVGARLRGGHRGAQAGETAADHQDLGLRRHLFVTVGVGLPGGFAETGHAPNGGLVQMPVGPLEGLVIEARRQQRGELAVDRAHIEADAGPAIDAGRHEALVELHQRRAHVRSAQGALAHIDQTGGFLDTAGKNPARPVQLEAAPHELHAVRQEGRRQGIAGVAAEAAAVEAEGQGLRAIHTPAPGRRKTRCGHGGSSGGGGESVMAYTDRIS